MVDPGVAWRRPFSLARMAPLRSPPVDLEGQRGQGGTLFSTIAARVLSLLSPRYNEHRDDAPTRRWPALLI